MRDGTCFGICKAPRASSVPEYIDARDGYSETVTERILIVEDEPALPATLQYGLKRAGYCLEVAGAGPAAARSGWIARGAREHVSFKDSTIPVAGGLAPLASTAGSCRRPVPSSLRPAPGGDYQTLTCFSEVHEGRLLVLA